MRASTAVFAVFIVTCIIFEVGYQTSDSPHQQDMQGMPLGVLAIGTLVFLAYRGLTRRD